MSHRVHIQNELQTIAPVLATAPVTMPYTLPENYFATLPATLLGLLNDQALVTLTNASRHMPYHLPVGYFQQFPQLMLQRVQQTNSNSVPAGYFESLPEQMLARVRSLETVIELEEIAPLLNTISKAPVQHIPVGYFDTLQPQLGQKPPENATPIVQMQRSKNTSWLTWATAACVAGLLGIGGYRYFSSSSAVVPSIANQPTVSAINTQLASVDESAIENYLNAGSNSSSAPQLNYFNELNTSDLDELLQDITDQQLKNYINQLPEFPTGATLKKS